MEYNKNQNSNSNKDLGSDNKSGAYYPPPGQEKSKKKFSPWMIALLMALGFGAYQFSKVQFNSPSTQTEKVAEPLANQLVDQSERQALIEAIRGVAGAEDRLSGVQKGTVTLEEHEKQYANTPEEHVQAKQGEAQQKAQEFGASHEDFEAILTKCYINGNDVHFVTKTGEILEHVHTNDKLSLAQYEQARLIINDAKGKELWIMIYKDRLETVSEKGELVQTIELK